MKTNVPAYTISVDDLNSFRALAELCQREKCASTAGCPLSRYSIDGQKRDKPCAVHTQAADVMARTRAVMGDRIL